MDTNNTVPFSIPLSRFSRLCVLWKFTASSYLIKYAIMYSQKTQIKNDCNSFRLCLRKLRYMLQNTFLKWHLHFAVTVLPDCCIEKSPITALSIQCVKSHNNFHLLCLYLYRSTYFICNMLSFFGPCF